MNKTDSESYPVATLVSVSLEVVLVCIIIVFNMLVVMVICCHRRLRKTFTNYYIVNLTISDLLMGFFGVFHIMAQVWPTLGDTHSGCLARFITVMTGGCLSIVSVFLITYDRFVAVVMPFYYRSYGAGCAAIIRCVVLDTMTLILCVLVPSLWNNPLEAGQYCSMASIMPHTYLAYILIPLYFTVTTTKVILYCIILYHMKTRLNRLYKLNPSHRTLNIFRNVTRDSNALTKTGAWVLALFIMCWLPFFINLSVQVYGEKYAPVYDTAGLVFFLLCLLNSVLNPIIYVWRMPSVRKQVTHFCCCSKPSSQDDQEPPSRVIWFLRFAQQAQTPSVRQRMASEALFTIHRDSYTLKHRRCQSEGFNIYRPSVSMEAIAELSHNSGSNVSGARKAMYNRSQSCPYRSHSDTKNMFTSNNSSIKSSNFHSDINRDIYSNCGITRDSDEITADNSGTNSSATSMKHKEIVAKNVTSTNSVSGKNNSVTDKYESHLTKIGTVMTNINSNQSKLPNLHGNKKSVMVPNLNTPKRTNDMKDITDNNITATSLNISNTDHQENNINLPGQRIKTTKKLQKDNITNPVDNNYDNMSDNKRTHVIKENGVINQGAQEITHVLHQPVNLTPKLRNSENKTSFNYDTSIPTASSHL